jgi:hypothetical protein
MQKFVRQPRGAQVTGCPDQIERSEAFEVEFTQPERFEMLADRSQMARIIRPHAAWLRDAGRPVRIDRRWRRSRVDRDAQEAAPKRESGRRDTAHNSVNREFVAAVQTKTRDGGAPDGRSRQRDGKEHVVSTPGARAGSIVRHDRLRQLSAAVVSLTLVKVNKCRTQTRDSLPDGGGTIRTLRNKLPREVISMSERPNRGIGKGARRMTEESFRIFYRAAI